MNLKKKSVVFTPCSTDLSGLKIHVAPSKMLWIWLVRNSGALRKAHIASLVDLICARPNSLTRFRTHLVSAACQFGHKLGENVRLFKPDFSKARKPNIFVCGSRSFAKNAIIKSMGTNLSLGFSVYLMREINCQQSYCCRVIYLCAHAN